MNKPHTVTFKHHNEHVCTNVNRLISIALQKHMKEEHAMNMTRLICKLHEQIHALGPNKLFILMKVLVR